MISKYYKIVPCTIVLQNTSSWKPGYYYILFCVDHKRVVERLESFVGGLFFESYSNRGWIFVHYPPSNAWGHNCNTKEIRALELTKQYSVVAKPHRFMVGVNYSPLL